MWQEIANWIALTTGLIFCGILLAIAVSWAFDMVTSYKENRSSARIRKTCLLLEREFGPIDQVPLQVVRDILISLEKGGNPDIVYSHYTHKQRT